MTAKDEVIAATRRQLWREQHGKCGHCGCTLLQGPYDVWQLAHVLPQDKPMLKLYGEAVIHHPLNLRLVCSEYCNARVSMRNHPEFEREHVAKIREAIASRVEREEL